jgi:hypothetical protein
MAPASLACPNTHMPTPSRTNLGRTRKQPLLARLIAGMQAAIERHNNREIEKFIRANGGMSDAVERELSRRFGGF